MTRRIKVVIWNPQDGANPIREEEIDSGLETLQALVHGNIEGIYPSNSIPELDRVHGYVNEEFLYTHPEWRERPWKIGAYEFLCGPCVFMGSDNAGNDVDCPVSIDVIKHHIRISPETVMAMLVDRMESQVEQAEVAPTQ